MTEVDQPIVNNKDSNDASRPLVPSKLKKLTVLPKKKKLKITDPFEYTRWAKNHHNSQQQLAHFIYMYLQWQHSQLDPTILHPSPTKPIN